jgi:hypothetical protein
LILVPMERPQKIPVRMSQGQKRVLRVSIWFRRGFFALLPSSRLRGFCSE